MIQSAQWLGLALRSESDQPHEWLYLAWVIRNRVEAHGFSSSYAGVITQAWQFSYFNEWTVPGLPPDEIYGEALKGYAGDKTGWADNNLSESEEFATVFMGTSRWAAPFGPRVLHFWSPRSMRPPGRVPSWAETMRVFSMSGVDPGRWLFGEG